MSGFVRTLLSEFSAAKRSLRKNADKLGDVCHLCDTTLRIIYNINLCGDYIHYPEISI